MPTDTKHLNIIGKLLAWLQIVGLSASNLHQWMVYSTTKHDPHETATCTLSLH